VRTAVAAPPPSEPDVATPDKPKAAATKEWSETKPVTGRLCVIDRYYYQARTAMVVPSVAYKDAEPSRGIFLWAST